MSARFKCDVNGAASPLPHFWEHTVGSDHALMALRADWREQIRRAHDELGFRHVRFHGLLCDDVGTLIAEGDKRFYSFHNADQIFDFLLSIGMKPFVELSFMPGTLASGDKTVFRYRANVTPPKDYAQWALLIRDLVAHWVERYGINEVRQWFFEVWNEPNLDAFGSGKQDDYFKLYRYTSEAVKSVDKALKVGGPATAENAWIADFIGFCTKSQLPADFISTHHYPTDAFGEPGDDTEAQLSKSRRSVLREQAQEVRRQAGERPVYYTEWCTSSNPRDPMHDEPYAAAFVIKTIMEANGLVQGYSYWTFSDIFEENYFPSEPFHGGFGLLNIHGIAKPAYRAFELLHALGTELTPVEGGHPTVDAWTVRDVESVTVLFTNYALPRHPIAAESIHMTLIGARSPAQVTIRRIDSDHANVKRRWQEMGSPKYLNAANIEELDSASLCQSEPHPFDFQGGTIDFDVTLPPLSVAAVTVQFGSSERG
ncbi:MAG TPA: glycosyl hydrolase [Alphaproteobacteria bacterium]|nr:glycosyl hydrolase [Alphaproteobacteria bacterium]